MGARRRQVEHKRASDDADHSLRAASRMFPHALTPFVVKEEEKVEHTEWTETQIASRERRLDRTLIVRLATGESRWLHVEWTDRLNRRVRERIAEYHWILSAISFQDARIRRQLGDKNAKPIGIETVLVVLGGRKKPWPEFGLYRSSLRQKKFCGVKFRIVAVYQKTVAELEAMGDPFWLAFVPLARDVDEEKLQRIVKKLRSKVDDDEFAELRTMLLSMAKLKKDVPRLVDVVKELVKEAIPVYFREEEIMTPKKIEQLKQEARMEGRREACLDALFSLVFVHQFERRLARTLTASEKRRLRKRLEKDGLEKIGDAVLDFSRFGLARWLAPRKASAKRSSVRQKPAASA